MIDPYEATYEQLAALLKAEPTFYDAAGAKIIGLVWPGNFIEFSGTTNRAMQPQKIPNANQESYPLAVLEEDSQQDTAFTKSVTFGTTKPGGACDWREQGTATWKLTLVGPDARTGPLSALRWAAKRAWTKGGAGLGVAGVVNWSFRSQSPPLMVAGPSSVAAPVNGTRRVMYCYITVNFNIDGPALIA